MSVASDLMEKFRTEEQSAAAETPVETTQQVETTEPVDNNQPEETGSDKPEEVKDKPEEAPPKDPEPNPEPSETPEPSEPTKDDTKQQKPDFSKLTKDQKAEHAFQRQLAKQLAKQKEHHNQEIEEMKKAFRTEIDNLRTEMTAKKEPEPLKTREDFPPDAGGDDAYIDYLASRRVDAKFAEREAEAAKAAEEKAKKEREEAEAEAYQREVANYFNTNAKNAFGDDYKSFEKIVEKGINNGLADVLDEAPAVRDFIFGNPDGPILLNEILSNKESFVRVMSRAANPMNAIIECHDLVKEIQSRKGNTETAQTATRVMPNLGKPGAGAAPSTAPDMWHDDKALVDFVRRRRT